MRTSLLSTPLALSLVISPLHASRAVAATVDPGRQQLLDLTREKIFARLYTGRFEARMHRACSALQSDDSGDAMAGLSWFRQFRADEAKIRVRCATSIAELRRSIRNNWPRMRIALSLMKARFMENRLLPDINTRIDVKAQHPFSGSVELPRLTAAEQARAIQLYEDEVSRLRALFRKKEAQMRPDYVAAASPREFLLGEERFVVQEFPAYRAAQERLYLDLLSELPILAFVDSPNPSPQTLQRALDRIAGNADELIEEMKKSELYDPDVLTEYAALLDETFREHPEMESAAKALRAEIERDRKREYYAEKTFVALLMLGSFIVDIEPFAVMISAAKMGYKAYSVVNAKMEERQRNAVFFTSVTRSMGIAQLERMNEARRESVLAQVMLPLALFSHANH